MSGDGEAGLGDKCFWMVGQVVAARIDVKSVVGEVLHGNLGAAFIYRFSAVEVA